MARRPWSVIAASGLGFGASVVGLGLAPSFALALVMLALVGAAGLIFQTTTMSLMLSLSDIEYHGRLQSMVVLGFSGFGLAALPLGSLADAWSLRAVLVSMGVAVALISVGFAWRRRAGRRALDRRLELA
jgi:MFS family permease